MIHALTMGHIDPEAVRSRTAVVRQPLNMGTVESLLRELGEADTEGRWRLGGSKVEFYNGSVGAASVLCAMLTPGLRPLSYCAQYAGSSDVIAHMADWTP